MSDFRFSPLGDRVIVKPDSLEQQTASGIIIPGSATGEEPQSGIIVALGKGGTWINCPNPSDFLKVGQRVWFNKYAGDDIEIKKGTEKTEYKVLRLDAVFGIDNETEA